MKHLILISLVLLIPGKDKLEFSLKNLDKSMVQIDDGLYACKYEVSNGWYKAYLQSLNTEEYIRHFPDTSAWIVSYPSSFNTPLAEYYFQHPAYYNYPVVNIADFCAEDFCKWLTAEYAKYDKAKYPGAVFRLPNEQEWMIAAGSNSTDKMPWEGQLVEDDQDQYLANVKIPVSESDASDFGADGFINSAPVDALEQEPNGLCNIIGNVAELVTDEFYFAKGGSWDHFPEESYPGLDLPLVEPTPTLGFRVFMEYTVK